MSADDQSAEPPEDPALTMRIGYLEREAAVETFRTAAGDSRITLAELDERMELVEAARYPIDLDRALEGIVTELPSARARADAGGRPGRGGTAADDLGWSPEAREVLHAPWAGLIRRGRWPVRPYLRCEPAGVLLELNFLEVETDLTTIDIDVAARTGTMRVVVPDSWGVDISGLRRSKIAVVTFKANEAAREGFPILRIGGSIGSGVIQALGPTGQQRRRLGM